MRQYPRYVDDIERKNKDIANAHRDLMEHGLMNELHLESVSSGHSMTLGSYMLDLDQRKRFCKWLGNVKFPDGFASNISRCV